MTDNEDTIVNFPITFDPPPSLDHKATDVLPEEVRVFVETAKTHGGYLSDKGHFLFSLFLQLLAFRPKSAVAFIASFHAMYGSWDLTEVQKDTLRDIMAILVSKKEQTAKNLKIVNETQDRTQIIDNLRAFNTDAKGNFLPLDQIFLSTEEVETVHIFISRFGPPTAAYFKTMTLEIKNHSESAMKLDLDYDELRYLPYLLNTVSNEGMNKRQRCLELKAVCDTVSQHGHSTDLEQIGKHFERVLKELMEYYQTTQGIRIDADLLLNGIPA